MENKENPNQRLEVDENLDTQMAEELNEALEDAQDAAEEKLSELEVKAEAEKENLKSALQNKLEEAKDKIGETWDRIENSKIADKVEDTFENAKEKAAESLASATETGDKMKAKLAGAWEQVGDKWEEVEESKLWNKITKYAAKAGIKVVYSALLLWFAYQREETPRWAKRIVLGVIAYFLSPIDLIPDLAPFLGFTDDFGILGMGLVAIAGYINDDVRVKSREKLSGWFPDYDEADLKDVDERV